MLKTLSKFSLDECDLPTMLWNISIFLRCLTINIDSRSKKGIPVIFYLCTLCSVVIYLYVYFFNMIWFVFVRCPQTGDLIAAMVVLSLGVSSEIGVIKLIFMVIYSDEVRRIVDNFLECDSHVIPGTRFSNNMLKILRSVKKRAIFYWVVLIANSVAYNSTPIFMAGRHMSEDLLVIYGLEPMLESPNFEIATVLSTITVSFICFTVANISGFIIILIGYVEAQMLSLTEEMKQVWMDAVADKKKSKDFKHLQNQPFTVVNKFIKLRLVNIINIHKTNISLLNDVEHLFRGPIGIGFVCLSVGIVAELLGGLQNTYLEVPFAIVQVSVDCYIGQKVMDASVLFERAVYDCKWEKFDNSNKKIVLTMLYNSQKTMQVSAAGMVNLSFSFLQSVLNSIYSAYTTLRPMIKKN